MFDDQSLHHEDYPLSNIRGVVSDPLQTAADDDQMDSPGYGLGVGNRIGHQLPEYLVIFLAELPGQIFFGPLIFRARKHFSCGSKFNKFPQVQKSCKIRNPRSLKAR